MPQSQGSDPSPNARVLDAALDYGARGWQVVIVHGLNGDQCTCDDLPKKKPKPCSKSRGKHPRLNDWGSKATDNTLLIRQQFTWRPNSNVGVKLGPESGIVDLEIDNPAVGEPILRDVFGGEIPLTPTFKGRQGPHRLFQWRDDLPKKGHIPLGWGDLKLGAGHHEKNGVLVPNATQSVLPPSRHHSGVNYEWIIHPDECPVAAIPDRVVEWMLANEVQSKKNGTAAKVVFNDQPLDTSPSVDSVLRMLRRGKNGPKFSALFDSGDISAHGNNQSSADMALVSRLAFYAGPDTALIDQLFRQSRLMRDKWDERRGDSTYGRKTIEKILSGRNDYFDWNRPKPSNDNVQNGVDMTAILRTYPPPQEDEQAPVDETEPDTTFPEFDEATEPPDEPPTEDVPTWKTGGLPQVWLPDGVVTYSQCAATLGGLMAATGRYYQRGKVPMRTLPDEHGGLKLDPLKPAATQSLVEGVARLMRTKVKKNGEVEDVPALCNETTAKALLAAEQFVAPLPAITVLSKCPVLTERNDGTLATICGYDRESGILAMGTAPPEISLDRAKEIIATLLRDFDFPTEGDRSRAAAAFITPALVLGGLLRGQRAAIDVAEADQSQSGKGYRFKLITSIYLHQARTVTQRERGVGSMQEAFDSQVIAGAPFISIDNLRGKLDLPWLESFVTESSYLARQPYSSPIAVDPRRTVLLMSSNKAEMTTDLANRSSVVRIRKRGDAYQFQKFPEGDLHAHVMANQPEFLGAIFTIVKEWHRLGKPVAETTQHDLRGWVSSLDWIVQNLLHMAPLMEGHRDVQARIANPALNWLRDVALAVIAAGKADVPLRTHEIIHLVVAKGIETKGVALDMDTEDNEVFNKALRSVGRVLSQVMQEDQIDIDGLHITRQHSTDSNGRGVKEYTFSPCSRIPPHSTPHQNACSPHPRIGVNTFQTFAGGNEQAYESSAPMREMAGRCGETPVAAKCNHIDPSTWVVKGDSKVCGVCGKWMGRTQPEECPF